VDQYLSTVIIALITGVFSVITLIIQKKQDKVISKIDEQTTFIDREKSLKQKLAQKEKERELLIQDMMILILDTNIYILKNSNIGDGNLSIEEVYKESDKLKEKFKALSEEIAEITNEYALVLDITNEVQRGLERSNPKK